MENPFRIFPEELWFLIIKNSKASSPQNLFQCFPQFFTTFSKHYPVQQFIQECSNIFKKKRSGVKFNPTQLISHEWCKAVENFVQYSPSEYFTEDSQAKLEFSFLSNEKANPKTLLFKDTMSINRFKKTNTSHVQAVNSSPQTYATEPVFEFCVHFLQKHGNNLKEVTLDFGYLEITVDTDPGTKDFSLLVKCLQNLQNVHTLSVNFAELDYFPCQPNNFPELPNLHTLTLYNSSDGCSAQYKTVWEYFHRGYIKTGQVIVLRIVNKKWQFTCVEEYELDKWCRTYRCDLDFRDYVKRNNLKRVTIKPFKIRVFVISVIWWLFTKRKYAREVVFENTSTKVATVGYELIPRLSCVKYLKITDATFLEYRFLCGLISLEHLHVVCDKKEHDNMFVYKLSEDRLTNVVRCYLYNDEVETAEVGIWSELPTLNSFVVQDKSSSGMCKQFVRRLQNKALIFMK